MNTVTAFGPIRRCGNALRFARLLALAGAVAAFSQAHGQTEALEVNSGTYNLLSGSTTYTQINVADAQNVTGVVLNQYGTAGGTPSVTVGTGLNSTGTWNMLSGAVLTARTLAVGAPGSGGGTFNQNAGSLTLASWAGTFQKGSYNLNGGDLTSTATNSATPGAGCPFYFNGGTLHAGVNNSAFFSSGSNVVSQVRNGGAVFDTAGYAITFPQTLAHSTVTGDNATDGGLTKQGEGTLTLSHASTFTGGVAINGGVLAATSDGALGTGTAVTTSGDGQLLYQLTSAGDATVRTFGLGVGSLGISGGTLTLSGAVINAGYLTGAMAVGTNGVTITGSTFYGSAKLNASGGTASLTNVTNNGAILTAGTGQILNWKGGASSGGTDARPALKVDGTANVANWSSTGVVVIDNGGTLGNTLSSLILGGGSRTTINSGGTLASTPNIELNGALLVNNGTVTGTLDVNYGSTVQGGGAFGTVNVADLGTLSSTGTINGAFTVAANGVVTLNGAGTLTVNGTVTNNGVMRFERGAKLAVANGSTFTNNGTLDILSGGFTTLPGGFVNNGIVLDASVVKVRTFAYSAGGPVSVSVDAYPGHTYALLRSDSLQDAFGGIAGVDPQSYPASNPSAVTATFSDPSPLPGEGFYRVAVDP